MLDNAQVEAIASWILMSLEDHVVVDETHGALQDIYDGTISTEDLSLNDWNSIRRQLAYQINEEWS